MKKLLYPILAGVILIGSAFATLSSQEWKISDGYSIKFSSKDPSGIFKEFKGVILFDESDLAGSKFDLTIDVSSISMGNGMKNKKSQLPEWFDAAKYPVIKYTSTKIEKTGSNYTITGDLKIKGTSKTYKIPFNFNNAGATGKFSGTFNVNRLDFKVGKDDGFVPANLKVEFTVPVAKK
jgi:polyisoprenoid-binding protein YceI